VRGLAVDVDELGLGVAAALNEVIDMRGRVFVGHSPTKAALLIEQNLARPLPGKSLYDHFSSVVPASGHDLGYTGDLEATIHPVDGMGKPSVQAFPIKVHIDLAGVEARQQSQVGLRRAPANGGRCHDWRCSAGVPHKPDPLLRPILNRDGSKMEVHVHTHDERPLTSRMYRVSPDRLPAMRDKLNEMMERGVIRRSHSSWSSPLVVFVPKPPGADGKPKWRCTVDMRQLNKKTDQAHWGAPIVVDSLDVRTSARTLAELYPEVLARRRQAPAVPQTKKGTTSRPLRCRPCTTTQRSALTLPRGL
jgi:hypothetical protein